MLLFTILFLWCPIFGILAYAVFLGHQRKVSVKALVSLAVMLSLYLGCLGTTKELLGDFLTYKKMFEMVPDDGLWGYILSFGNKGMQSAQKEGAPGSSGRPVHGT